MQIYKITNKINGKIYVGQTSKDDPNYIPLGIYNFRVANNLKKIAHHFLFLLLCVS